MNYPAPRGGVSLMISFLRLHSWENPQDILPQNKTHHER